MKPRTKENAELTHRVGDLLSQTQLVCDADPEMCEAAEMVYIGDVYVLREPATLLDEGWGSRHYVADLEDDPL